MKKVDVEEFSRHAAKYVAGSEAVAVELDGRTIGFFVPAAKRAWDGFQQAIDRLEKGIQETLEETGMTEDELADLFDLNKPLPETPKVHVGAHASRR
jgi:hypothetical protein